VQVPRQPLSPQEHSKLAQHLLALSQNEQDPQRRKRLNELALMNAAFGAGQQNQAENL
jgi:hypothetical protein